jgi:hypothetical protein
VACMNEGHLANRIALGLVADTLHELESDSTRLWSCATEVSVEGKTWIHRQCMGGWQTGSQRPGPVHGSHVVQYRPIISVRGRLCTCADE